MLRVTYIERVRRLIYNGQPSDDSVITVGMVNVLLNDAIGIAAKANYKENLSIDGVAYVNNSFYTTFKGLAVTEDSQFVYKVTLPQIPFGVGNSEGISSLVFKDFESKQLSQSVIWLTANQATYFDTMRPIPNKIQALSQGQNVLIKTTLMLDQYTANATMISGGLNNDLDGELNVPADYLPIMDSYLITKLLQSKQIPIDASNDGLDADRGIQ